MGIVSRYKASIYKKENVWFWRLRFARSVGAYAGNPVYAHYDLDSVRGFESSFQAMRDLFLSWRKLTRNNIDDSLGVDYFLH